MNLRVIERAETELVIEIAGEDHTFMNVLKGALLADESVSSATYDMNPEQSGGQTDPVLTVTTEPGTEPLEAVRAAAERIKAQLTEFRAAFEDAAA
ncbi:MAG: DNA-directed RNA polymerase subunit L [Halodesulfurarchaeum sp.]